MNSVYHEGYDTDDLCNATISLGFMKTDDKAYAGLDMLMCTLRSYHSAFLFRIDYFPFSALPLLHHKLLTHYYLSLDDQFYGGVSPSNPLPGVAGLPQNMVTAMFTFDPANPNVEVEFIPNPKYGCCFRT